MNASHTLNGIWTTSLSCSSVAARATSFTDEKLIIYASATGKDSFADLFYTPASTSSAYFNNPSITASLRSSANAGRIDTIPPKRTRASVPDQHTQRLKVNHWRAGALKRDREFADTLARIGQNHADGQRQPAARQRRGGPGDEVGVLDNLARRPQPCGI